MHSETVPLIVVAGPTASGKSALGLAIAQHVGGTIINADSMQIYRDLRILTARPSDDEMTLVPHRLYGVVDGSEKGTAAFWCRLAREAIAEAAASGRVPILLGGTGLYLRALLEGLVELPPIPEAARDEARAKLAALGAPGLHAELSRLDPETAARLKPGDRQRLVRAYEVVVGTGRGLEAWYREAPRDAPLPNPVFRLLLRPDRAALYQRIDRRFMTMIAEGALDEVQAVMARGEFPEEAPMRKAHGLPELMRHLKGEISLDEAIRLGQRNTRHYAKRQTTWFRNQFEPELLVENAVWQQENFNLEAEIFPKIVEYLLTARQTGD